MRQWSNEIRVFKFIKFYLNDAWSECLVCIAYKARNETKLFYFQNCVENELFFQQDVLLYEEIFCFVLFLFLLLMYDINHWHDWEHFPTDMTGCARSILVSRLTLYSKPGYERTVTPLHSDVWWTVTIDVHLMDGEGPQFSVLTWHVRSQILQKLRMHCTTKKSMTSTPSSNPPPPFSGVHHFSQSTKSKNCETRFKPPCFD